MKMMLEAAISKSEATLGQVEDKVLRCQLDLNQVQQEIVCKISEKKVEFVLINKNYSKAVKNMQSALETEAKAKAEALCMKKKLEGDVGDMEIALDHANAAAVETQGSLKKYQTQIRHAQMKLEVESSLKSADQEAPFLCPTNTARKYFHQLEKLIKVHCTSLVAQNANKSLL